MKGFPPRLKAGITLAVMVCSVLLWFQGLSNAPFTPARQAALKKHMQQQAVKKDPAMEEERRLANGYWQRYPDVAAHEYFGRNGLMGIGGARAHYTQYGKAEGRHWGP